MDKDTFDALAAPFPPERISWRLGSTNKDKMRGLALAYIDARDVMERLDAVVGPAGWQNDYPHANGKTVCRIGIKIGNEWVWKSDGAGDSDVEAEKGALSDAFKRAAVRWGVGRYLYDLPSPWVAIEAYGKSFKIADSEYKKLRAVLANEKMPDNDAIESPLTPTGSKKSADRMIAELRAAPNLNDFMAIRTSSTFKNDYAKLLTEDKDRVATAGGDRKAELEELEHA